MRYEVYTSRRQALNKLIAKQYGFGPEDMVVLFAGFEREAAVFLQENNFYYLSGINEPATALVIGLEGELEIYQPDTGGLRAKWVTGSISDANASEFGLKSVNFLGDKISGYEATPFIQASNYSNLLNRLRESVQNGGKVFTVSKNKLEQSFLWDQLCNFEPMIRKAIIEISDLLGVLRRTKSDLEIGYLCQAIEITAMAQEAAAKTIAVGVVECEVQAAIEYVFTSSGAGLAFPSIVGGGVNSTILHYVKNDSELQANDLVVVDIGARYQHYCADITRTYPVGGKFTPRQREIYEIVLQTQEYIASLAKPGMWIVNKDCPEMSLTHLAREFMRQKGGYDQYFIHGIGHYLGLDVHDVGSLATPLAAGDVITIEPGIYISSERLGVRIEDNYLLTDKGAICLSGQIPKEATEIENLSLGKW